MNKLTTNGVCISVEVQFQPAHSEPIKNKYLFVYHIKIENQNPFPVQLLHRHWIIVEADGKIKEVKGEGVIGVQPVIEPAASHSYNSFSIISQEIGYMEGTYSLIRLDDHTPFQSEIPRFYLEVPFILN